jgi:predicted RND superfamily exporter protein
VSELPAHDDSVQASAFMEERLTGILPFDVVLVAERAARLTDPDVDRAMAAEQRFADRQELGFTLRSYADVLAALERALGVVDRAPVETWSDAKVRQMQLLLEMSSKEEQARAVRGLLAEEHGMARVMGLSKDLGSGPFGLFRDLLEVEARRLVPADVEVHVSGGYVIASRGLQNIVRDMMSSLGLAIVSIFFFITALFRSLRLGLVALLPNVLPIFTALAAMALLDVQIRVATVIIFSMALGVAVDSCVHLLARLDEERRGGRTHSLEEALVATLRGAGRPVVYAMMLLLLGFLVLGFSEFQALRDFAVLSFLTLGAALVVDLVLLPASVRLVGLRRLP